MAQKTDIDTDNPKSADGPKGGGSRGQSGGGTSASSGGGTSGSREESGTSSRKGSHLSSPGRRRYLIATRRMSGMTAFGTGPVSLNTLLEGLRANADIEVMDTIGPKAVLGTLSDGMPGAPHVIVAKMDDRKADILRQQAHGQLLVERDHPVTLLDVPMPLPPMAASVSGAPAVTAQFLVLGKDDKPLEGAEIYLYGSLMPAVGVTNSSGQATLSVLGDTPHSIRAIHVKPKSDHWSFYQSEPVIDTSQPNIVSLKALSDSFPDFPSRQLLGWGERIMRLDQLPQERRGQGVKIAIIDSGVATTHEDLNSITKGYDVTSKAAHDDGRDWQVDTLAHGSHCAGLIAGHSSSKMGIVGFAPAAEIHVCKIFPGAQISQLIDALEYCVEQQIDVVNLSLGIDEPSEVLEQQLARVTSLGVACIVAAGNSGGPVQYPASSPNVLAVAAIGRMGEFPVDSSHAQSVQRPGVEGFFSPRFTCFGPEIAVCAPGVAILSSVPPNNFAARDGTSMAASHVAGVAALVLAHHPDFAGAFKARNAVRVARLFQILKASARPLDVGDPRRTGFGVPDVPTAISLQLGTQPTSFAAAPVGQAGAGFGNPFYGGSMGGMSAGPGFAPEPFMAALAQQLQFGAVANEASPWNVGVWGRRTGWS